MVCNYISMRNFEHLIGRETKTVAIQAREFELQGRLPRTSARDTRETIKAFGKVKYDNTDSDCEIMGATPGKSKETPEIKIIPLPGSSDSPDGSDSSGSPGGSSQGGKNRRRRRKSKRKGYLVVQDKKPFVPKISKVKTVRDMLPDQQFSEWWHKFQFAVESDLKANVITPRDACDYLMMKVTEPIANSFSRFMREHPEPKWVEIVDELEGRYGARLDPAEYQRQFHSRVPLAMELLDAWIDDMLTTCEKGYDTFNSAQVHEMVLGQATEMLGRDRSVYSAVNMAKARGDLKTIKSLRKFCQNMWVGGVLPTDAAIRMAQAVVMVDPMTIKSFKPPTVPIKAMSVNAAQSSEESSNFMQHRDVSQVRWNDERKGKSGDYRQSKPDNRQDNDEKSNRKSEDYRPSRSTNRRDYDDKFKSDFNKNKDERERRFSKERYQPSTSKDGSRNNSRDGSRKPTGQGSREPSRD